MDLSFENGDRLKTRTEGDGMESVRSESSERPHRMGALINLQPNEIRFGQRAKSLSKEPKFVPYEPYKAATRPIVPVGRVGRAVKKPSRNDLDLSALVSQMAMVDKTQAPFETPRRPPRAERPEPPPEEPADGPTRKRLEAELELTNGKITSLDLENNTLKDQIKQQAQINKELKTMLVASMGEDLETTVQTLTEDKQQLASALINSVRHLSTHQEQTEWLAGQCEVWRSKFLASSLMVEELAGWKTAFAERTGDLEAALKLILEERNRVRDAQIHTYGNLRRLHENWLTDLASKELHYTSMGESGGFGGEPTPIGRINLISSRPDSSNVVDLASANLKFSENLCTKVERGDDVTRLLNELPAATDAEILAEKLLATPLKVSLKNDQPSSALVNLARAKTATTPNIACCSHCNGRVQLL